MQANAQCKVCREWHLLTRDGTMSIHENADGVRCAGSVGLRARRVANRAHVPTPTPEVRLETNHPPYSRQSFACGVCMFDVPVTIYGALAPHRVVTVGASPSKKRSKAERRLCAGSGAEVSPESLEFLPATPPVIQGASPRPAKVKLACPRCGVVVVKVGDGPLPAHQRPTYRWCAEGKAPTEAEKFKAKGRRKKGSVWSVGGGLPTLGKGSQ